MVLKQQKLASQINPKYVIAGDCRMVYKNLHPELISIGDENFTMYSYNDSK